MKFSKIFEMEAIKIQLKGIEPDVIVLLPTDCTIMNLFDNDFVYEIFPEIKLAVIK